MNDFLKHINGKTVILEVKKVKDGFYVQGIYPKRNETYTLGFFPGQKIVEEAKKIPMKKKTSKK